MADAPPPGINLEEDAKGRVIGAVIPLMALSTIAVALRITARLTTKIPLHWDDYTILVALAFAYGTGIVSILSCYAGIGRHIWAPSVNVKQVVQYLWAYEFVYFTVVPLVKISVILLYRRVFPVRPGAYALSFCAFIVISWWIAMIVVVCVQCRPYSYFWDQYINPSAQGKCIDLYPFYLGSAISSVITDFIILVVPIPMVLYLQMPITQKLAVCGVFLLGGFACVAGVVRVYFLTFIARSADLTWNMVDPFLWSCVEPCIGIVSACLATLRPMLRLMFPHCLAGSKRSAGTYGTGSHSRFKSQNGEFYRLQDKASLRSAADEIRLANEVDIGVPKMNSGREMGGRLSGFNFSVTGDIERSNSTVLAERV